MSKRARFFHRNPSPVAEEAKSFLEENGIKVECRDLTEKPLGKYELQVLVGYHNPKNYLDVTSAAYKEHKLDETLPVLTELLDIMIENPDLLRAPIIMAGRLMMIGTHRKQLIEMFQLKNAGNGSNGSRRGDREGNR